jgi:hypothetical protein
MGPPVSEGTGLKTLRHRIHSRIGFAYTGNQENRRSVTLFRF